MSSSDQADSEFQKLIKTFRDAFGIQREEDVQTEQRKILSQSIRIDAIVVFPDDFDFTTLRDRILPFH